ncbi:MAG: crAss001_48 related protein [Paraclostridium sp.]
MEDFIKRLITEKEELSEKRSKLEAFIGTDKFTDLAATHMSLLNIQLQAMLTYEQCLVERIAYSVYRSAMAL